MDHSEARARRKRVYRDRWRGKPGSGLVTWGIGFVIIGAGGVLVGGALLLTANPHAWMAGFFGILGLVIGFPAILLGASLWGVGVQKGRTTGRPTGRRERL